MINSRGWIVLAALAILTASIAQSRAAPSFRRQVDCDAVRKVVAMIGAAEAEKIARSGGASDAQIAAAKRCLK